MIKKLALVAALSVAATTSAMAQWSGYEGGYYGPGGPNVAGTNDNYAARDRRPFGPDGTGSNYEYFRSSGPDRGNSVESQR